MQTEHLCAQIIHLVVTIYSGFYFSELFAVMSADTAAVDAAMTATVSAVTVSIGSCCGC